MEIKVFSESFAVVSKFSIVKVIELVEDYLSCENSQYPRLMDPTI